MASLTTRLKLRKPASTDAVNVDTDISANLDLLDDAIGFHVCTSGTRPATPYDGQTIIETDTNRVYIWFNSTWNRVVYNGAGDDLNIGKGSAAAYAYLNGAAASYRALRGLTNGAARWLLALGETTAESGGNAGSNLNIIRYDDAGAYLGQPLTINRSSGILQILEGLLVGSVSPSDLIGPASTYAPALTGWGIGNGTVNGYYYKIGRLVFFKATIIFGSTSTFAGNPVVSLPFAASAATNNFHIFSCYGSHSSVVYPLFTAIGPGYSTVGISCPQVSGANIQANPVTSAIPFAWGNGDQIRLEGWFEAGS